MHLNQVTGAVVNAAYFVHTRVGPGLLESAYSQMLAHVLRKRGLRVDTEVDLPLQFEDLFIERAYRVDLLVEHRVPVELKAVGALHDVHFAQALTYVRSGSFKVGLLINFGGLALEDNLHRIANGAPNLR